MADLWQARGSKQYEMDDIMLLKVGRHLRPAPHFKLIIAREEGEAKFLQGYRKQFISLKTTSHGGAAGADRRRAQRGRDRAGRHDWWRVTARGGMRSWSILS